MVVIGVWKASEMYAYYVIFTRLGLDSQDELFLKNGGHAWKRV